MAGSSTPARRRNNRANWIALRTLRQVPKVVGRTNAGDPIYQIRDVRLVLRGDAAYFNRIVSCAKCRRDVPGPAVLSPSDLDHHPNSVICKDCVRRATQPPPETEQRSAAVADPPVATGAPGNGAGAAPARVSATEVEDAELEDAELEPPDDSRLVALEERLAELAELVRTQRSKAEAALDRRIREVRAELTTVAAAAPQPTPTQEELDRALDRAVERHGPSAAGDYARLERLDRRIGEEVERLTARVEGQRSELRTTLEGLFERLQAALEEEVADLTLTQEQLSGAEDRMSRRMDGLAKRVSREAEANKVRMEALEQRLQEPVDQAALQHVTESLARIEEQLNERLDRLAERAARGHEPDGGRLQTVEGRVEEAVGRLAETVESHRAELQAGLREGLDEVRSAMTEISHGNDRRLETLEEDAERRSAEVTEVVELQAALDAGLGQLRSQIAGLRDVTKQLADGQEEIAGRLQAMSEGQRPAGAEQGRGRRLGGRSEGSQMAAVSAVTDDLAREHQQIKAQLALLDQTTGAAADAAATASSQASALAPLRSDVRALAEELAAQSKAVASLTRSVERLRRKVPDEPPAATRAPKVAKATKATKAAKATRATKATKATKAR